MAYVGKSPLTGKEIGQMPTGPTSNDPNAVIAPSAFWPAAGAPAPDTGMGGAPAAPPDQAPSEPVQNGDVNTLPADLVGDIPPPPIPAPPALIQGAGVGGIKGTEAGTLSRPGSAGAAPFRTSAFTTFHPPRFGPGVANAGGAPTPFSGVSDNQGLGLNPNDAADLLRRLAGGQG